MINKKHSSLIHLALAGLLCLTVLPAVAQLPKRDLTVELRQVEEHAGYTASTQARGGLLAPQQVQVRNGEKASLRLGQSLPMHWVQAVSSQSASLSAPGVTARGRGGAVVNAVTWMEAGQSITVQPRWPGSKQAATVEIEVQSASVEARTGPELPAQSRTQVVTTVSAPLGQWVTIASTGASPQPGVYGSEAAGEARRLLQIRVLAP